jgi:hypothetical protein
MFSPLDAASQLRALNGLDAPKRMEVGGPNGGPIPLVTAQMTPQQAAEAYAATLTSAHDGEG